MKTFSMFAALCWIRLCQMDKPATNFSRRSSLPSAFMKTEFLDGSYQDLSKNKDEEYSRVKHSGFSGIVAVDIDK